MQCNDVLSQLDAFADRETGWRQTRRIRRHLRTCSDCAAALKEIEEITMQTRKWGEASAPTQMKSRILAALSPSSDAADWAPPAPKTAPGLRRPWVNVALALGGTGAMVVAGFILFFSSRPLPAFADVERAMLGVKNVQYRMVDTTYDATGRAVDVDTTETTLCFSPAVSVSQSREQDLSDPKHPEETVQYFLSNQDRFIVYNGNDQEYRILRNVALPGMNPPAKETERMQKAFLRTISPQPVSNDVSTVGRLKHETRATPWHIQPVTVSGQALLRFQSERTVLQDDKIFSEHQDTLWVDPQTRLVVRSEWKMFRPKTHKLWNVIVNDNFRYNTPLSEQVLALPMPPDAHLRIPNAVATKAGWDALDAVDRAAIEALIAQADQGWQEGDSAKFASVWDFDYSGATYPTEAGREQFHQGRTQFWEKQIAAQRGQWKSWHSRVDKAAPVYLFGDQPDVLMVTAYTNLRWMEGDDPYGGNFTYFVRRTPNGWRIVDWDPSLTFLQNFHTKRMEAKQDSH